MDLSYNKLNQITPCISFQDFLEKINCWYGQSIAFKDYKNNWKYNDLYIAIHNVLPYFIKREVQYYYINIGHPVYFCIAFFAIIISGKVALLSSVGPNEPETIEIINEKDVVALLQSADDGDFPPKCDNAKLAIIAQSSGTTSISKAVMLSQKNLLSDTIGGMQLYDYPKGAIYYNILPYSHLFGLVADMLGPLYSGGTICFSDNKLNFFKDLQYFCPTHMNLPPAMVYMIEKMMDKTNNITIATGGKLKKIMCAGAYLEEETINKLQRAGIYVFPAYGLTECSPCVSMNSELFSKSGSVGKILPCCKVKIVDNEITVQGDIVMLGYWNDSVATKHTIREGWLYTGDYGYIDDEGFLFLTGRKSNLIVFEDGTKIIPEQLEKKISSMRGVKECVLKKVQIDFRTRMKLIVVIENKKDVSKLTSEIQNYFEKQNLLNRIATITFTTDGLPKNKLGKIIRR